MIGYSSLLLSAYVITGGSGSGSDSGSGISLTTHLSSINWQVCLSVNEGGLTSVAFGGICQTPSSNGDS